jgi:XTP/dITP diphosphohydrolase
MEDRPLLEFAEVMETLRAECGWKREQTHRSLARYLVEETWEVLDAIDSGDLEHLREELGDLLLQIYFHAIIAAEEGAFTIDDVARDIIAKMKRRNPHVYPPPGEQRAPGGDAETINELWESIKAQEKSRSSVTDGIPPGLPALLYADKVLDRLIREGRPPSADEDAQPSPRDAGSDLGDRLLALVVEARESGVDPEQALRDAVRRLLADAGP